MRRKILITGGCGFVGSNLAMRLAARGDLVVLNDTLARDGAQNNWKHLNKMFPDIHLIQRPISDMAEISKYDDFDLVYHLAAQTAVTASYEDPHKDFLTNAYGSFLVASAGIPTIYASTNKVYGDNVNDVPIKEFDTRYDFFGELEGVGISEKFSIDAKEHTPYGVSKLTGEMYVREYGGVVNRFSCMYGDNQYGTTDQGWVSHFLFSSARNEPITIYGDGKQIRDALYVSDVVNLLERQGDMIKDIRGEVFTIGGGHKNTISVIELADMLKLERSFGEWRPADQKVYYSDIRKAQKLLGWEPKVSVQDGINATVNWIKKTFAHK